MQRLVDAGQIITFCAEEKDDAHGHMQRMGDPYALHVYETYWAGYLSGVDETYMKTRDTLFARLFKDLV